MLDVRLSKSRPASNSRPCPPCPPCNPDILRFTFYVLRFTPSLMRIVHLSTSDRAGGAARAAFRLHQALLAAGEESAMLVQSKTSDLDTVHQAAAPQDAAGSFLGQLI